LLAGSTRRTERASIRTLRTAWAAGARCTDRTRGASDRAGAPQRAVRAVGADPGRAAWSLRTGRRARSAVGAQRAPCTRGTCLPAGAHRRPRALWPRRTAGALGTRRRSGAQRTLRACGDRGAACRGCARTERAIRVRRARGPFGLDPRRLRTAAATARRLWLPDSPDPLPHPVRRHVGDVTVKRRLLDLGVRSRERGDRTDAGHYDRHERGQSQHSEAMLHVFRFTSPRSSSK
jgi:hypothetical protein